MEQTYDNIEYVFVNDCTQDESMRILRDICDGYEYRKSMIKVVNHKMNMGLPKARVSALNLCEGEYIIHCDSDDYPDSNWIETLVDEAIKSKADIVWCDYMSFHENTTRYHSQKPRNNLTPKSVLLDMIDGYKTGNLWTHLVKKEIVKAGDIKCPTWNFGEDLTLVFQYFLKATKISYVAKSLYNYRINTSGISNTTDKEKFASYVADDFKTIDLILSLSKSKHVYKKCLAKQFYKRRRIFDLYGYGRNGMSKWRGYGRKLSVYHLFQSQMGFKEKMYHLILFIKSYICLMYK